MGKHVNPVRVAELNSEFFALQELKLKQNDLQFFHKFKFFLEENSSSDRTIVIGKFFNEKTHNHFYSDAFKALIKGYEKYHLKVDFSNIGRIYVMNSVGYIEDARNAMWEEVFLLVLFSLTVEPNLGKEFLDCVIAPHQVYNLCLRVKPGVFKNVQFIYTGGKYQFDLSYEDDTDDKNVACLYFK